MAFIPIYAVMETEKSHDLLSRKADGTIQSEPKSLRSRDADDVRPSPKAGKNKMRCLSSNSEAEGRREKETNSSFFHLLFYSRLQQIG